MTYRFPNKVHYLIAIGVVSMLPLGILSAAKDPKISDKIYDFTAGDKLPEGRSHDWTLGPTGAKGWCQVGAGLGAAGNTAPSRQIWVTSVAEKSPASKVLKEGDFILGIGEKKFEKDARITFAKAIGAAESTDGKLMLLRYRDGKSTQVEIQLPLLPPFSETAPFDCEKSEMLLKQGCEALSKRGVGRSGIASDINALALLASGDKKYMDQAAEYIQERASKTLSPEIGLPCWHFAFKNILLCEYYLLTQDENVLPEIEHLTKHLINGRGPLSTWGHSFVDPTNQRLRGYGAVNAVGVPVVLSIVLAKECGVELKDMDKTISDSAQFFRRHLGMGAIPYGDGPPTTQYGHDDNGKNSAAALFFNLLGDVKATRYYTRTAMASFGQDREQGHTGNFFNMFWSLPAVALGGPESTGMWLERFGWYYDLARGHQHRYAYQGYPNERSNNVHSKWDCPGAYLLHFALGQKKLRITGRVPVCITPFTTQENKENIAAARVNYSGAILEELNAAVSSWSPVARVRAEKELRKRGLLSTLGYGLGSNDPLHRIAAVKSLVSFDDGIVMLEDDDIRVRIATMRALARLDKTKAAEAVLTHIAKVGTESPVFTQKIADIFFPIGSSASKIGNYLKSVEDREVAMKAIRILLDDQDAYVASRVAMGIVGLSQGEQRQLLPAVIHKAQNLPTGNVMFVNGLRVACIQVLAKWKLQEGLDLAVELLIDQSWGRNARLPRAATAVASYGGYAKPALDKLEKEKKVYDAKGSKWSAVLQKAIDAIEKAPKVKGKLKTMKELK